MTEIERLDSRLRLQQRAIEDIVQRVEGLGIECVGLRQLLAGLSDVFLCILLNADNKRGLEDFLSAPDMSPEQAAWVLLSDQAAWECRRCGWCIYCCF